MEILLMAIGAVLGVALSWLTSFTYSRIKRANPISATVKRSEVPPAWFATNMPLPTSQDEITEFDYKIKHHEPFCGFGKICVSLRNASKDVVYITSIDLKKELVEANYETRAFFMAQGGCGPVRLNAVLDDERIVFSTDFENRHTFHGDYFLNGNRIKIMPGEDEILALGFVAVHNAWRFNLDIHYTVANSERVLGSVMPQDELIVPYRPEFFKQDYCSLFWPEQPPSNMFHETPYFTEQMRLADPERQHSEAMSTIEFLEQFL